MPPRAPAFALRALAALATLFVAGVGVPPLLADAHPALAFVARMVYAPLCHQIAARSLTLGAGTLAVCARCSGLYAGALAALLLAVVLVPQRPTLRVGWLVLAWAPSLVDFALGQIGAPALGNGPRMIVAIPAGFVTGLFLAAAVAEVAAHGWRTDDARDGDAPALPRR